MFQMGWRVKLRLEGFGGGWMGGPITTPGLTVEMEKGGLEMVVRFSPFERSGGDEIGDYKCCYLVFIAKFPDCSFA